ncbi:uncharacterized protein EV422DRAFT_218050 [Fimicolochytrium jonesii]|uniref:uncharacterized protein n=1 Tax=Fimicolochytrium jonesii TaxID=1396493 RepID=UPI0022FE9F99|nr:uncharacterized protein EV422DRAFT_218050 [Fimicolochytrium jonesii]KAI8817564.1 hypothetical protein EV422DRAFT_218050 [Fimicolochytrium jonesii]
MSAETVPIEDLGSKPCLKPCIPMYGPCNLRDLKGGEVKSWCTCGLSTTQPWCDDVSHKGTGFKPKRWKVPTDQTLFSICNCKYTRDPPYCDATRAYTHLNQY